MTQCNRILEYIDKHGGITRTEALSEIGIANLPARIRDLRMAGIPIELEIVKGKNRYGEVIRYARYRRAA